MTNKSQCGTETKCGQTPVCVDESIDEKPCPVPVYEEQRFIRTVEKCTPKVVSTPNGNIEISGASCNLLTADDDGLFASAVITPSVDNAITFSGCGTAASPFVPAINYAALEAQLDDGDATVYATLTKCGWQWQNGKLVTTGNLITSLGSSDSSVTISYNAATCSYDIKLPTASSSTPLPTDPAEVGIIKASSATAGGFKNVTVTIQNVPAGSAGSVTVTPDVGVAPPPQTYTATGGVASLTFAIDPASTTADVVGNNSARHLVPQTAKFNIQC